MAWLFDLTELGYSNPLPAPFPAVQATLASIVGSKIHIFVQDTNNAAFLDKDNDGEHVPLLLSTLDLSHWTAIMHASTLENGIEKALSQLQEAHLVLAMQLERDELELEEATNNARVVKTAVGAANSHEDWFDCLQQTRAAESLEVLHPIVE